MVCVWLMTMTMVETHRFSAAGLRTTKQMNASSATRASAATLATVADPAIRLSQYTHFVGSVMDKRASPKAAQLPGGRPWQVATSGRQFCVAAPLGLRNRKIEAIVTKVPVLEERQVTKLCR